MSKNGMERITKNVDFSEIGKVSFEPDGYKVYQIFLYDKVEVGAFPVATASCYDKEDLVNYCSDICEKNDWRCFNTQAFYNKYYNEMYEHPIAICVDTGEIINS